MNYELIKLVSEAYSKDSNGVDKATYTEKQVFAKVMSISGKEFFNAGNANIKPEFKFVVNADEYNGAKIIKYGSTVYSVYRTYQTLEHTVELYAELKEGLN